MVAYWARSFNLVGFGAQRKAGVRSVKGNSDFIVTRRGREKRPDIK